jgi:thiol peroxidase
MDNPRRAAEFRPARPADARRIEMTERANVVSSNGAPLTLIGPEIRVGDAAPAFTVVGGDLADIESSAYAGKVLVLSVTPSIDTGVCATQTRTFNEKVTGLGDDVVVLGVSMDLPFAQGRFCGAEGIERVVMVSDYKYHGFGTAYGVRVKELGLLARSVFVIDRQGKVAYVQIVPEIPEEPDYDAALAAVQAAL